MLAILNFQAGPPVETSASLKSTNGALHDVLEQTERQQILKLLNRAIGFVAGPNGAASHLGMKRSTLQLRMQSSDCTRFCLVAATYSSHLFSKVLAQSILLSVSQETAAYHLLALPRWHLDFRERSFGSPSRYKSVSSATLTGLRLPTA